MLRDVAAFFADPPEPLAAFETTDADQGRVETRRRREPIDADWLFSYRLYAGERRLPASPPSPASRPSRSDAGRTSTCPRATTSPSTAPHPARPSLATCAPIGRSRTACTGCLDLTFHEDRARNRRDAGPENLAILRRLTLNLLNKARPEISAARKRKRSGWSDAFARTIIGQMR